MERLAVAVRTCVGFKWGRLLRIWLAWSWRTILIAWGGSFVLGSLMIFFGAGLEGIHHFGTPVAYIWGILSGIWAFKTTLNLDFGDFQICLQSTETAQEGVTHLEEPPKEILREPEVLSTLFLPKEHSFITLGDLRPLPEPLSKLTEPEPSLLSLANQAPTGSLASLPMKRS